MKNKKISKFNIECPSENGILIYNTFSSGVLSLNEEYSNEYSNLKKYGTCRKDLFNELCNGSMLIDKNTNEVSKINILSKSERFSTNCLSLTIAPTLSCNFKCPYCYEKGVEMNSMTKEIIHETIDFIKYRIDNNTKLGIAWYGGEPLLEINTIEYITKKLFETLDSIEENFEANIVTNGYLLSKEVALKLKNCKVKHAQITLDGPPKIHDKRRILMNNKPTFNKIINNIKECCNILDITIRINVDKTNIEYINDIVLILKENDIYDKVNVYLAPVDDINSKSKNTDCFDTIEFANKESAFTKFKLQSELHNSIVPDCNLGICGAVNLNSFVIAPDGRLYKCWDEIGRIESSVGNVSTGITYNDTLDFYLNYDVLSEKCKDCSYLPTCMGGCPYKKKMLGENQCFSLKYNIMDVLKRL
ncbi:radical SAM protein [Peptostreptococcus anaerobius]|uniref:radical SAM protein n=1 Tax=Peptostreptococcus anaerobius TaxID=1261 RepID=UPI003564103B